MGCCHIPSTSHRLHHSTISLLFFLIFSSSQLRFMAEGRAIHNKVAISQEENENSKMILRGKIGSRPPRCERRCSSCGHCEAIQVPTNPQLKPGSKNSSVVSNIAYARGDENSSNYKPMSWKCKCGDSIFNP